jgi:hypothetical protein
MSSPPSGSRPSIKEEAMRNEAMEQLDVLVGSWQTTMRNAWFLEPADQEVAGSATVEWLGDAFVVFRWTMEGDVGKATSEMVLVLGRSDAHDARWPRILGQRPQNSGSGLTQRAHKGASKRWWC